MKGYRFKTGPIPESTLAEDVPFDPAPKVSPEMQKWLTAHREKLRLATADQTHPALKAFLEKGHVEPENAVPISLPLADPTTEADVQHVAWSLVREGRAQLRERTVPIADLVATQAVVDSERVARDEAEYRERGQGDEMPLVLDGSLVDGGKGKMFCLSGHHHVSGAAQAGATELRVQVMS